MYATVVGTSRQAFAAICLVAHKHGTFTREDADLLGQTVEGVIPPWIFPFYDKPLARGRKWAEHVGKKIKEFREQAQLTQVQLAEKAGLPQSHISRLEIAESSATHLTLKMTLKKNFKSIGGKYWTN